MPYLIIGNKDGRLITFAKSPDYNTLWEAWEGDQSKKVIVWSQNDVDGPYIFSSPYYIVTEGRKPAVYTDYAQAEKQTDGITGKPDKVAEYIQACRLWSRSKIIRRENNSVEMMRKSCGCCWYCGRTLSNDFSKRGLGQKEHQLPKHKQGGNELGNLVYACHTCNVEEKNWRDVEELRDKWSHERFHELPNGDVKFFGELTRDRRHEFKLSREHTWQCPSNDDVACCP